MTVTNVENVIRLGVLTLALIPQLALAQAVTTYHNDTLRTGWNYTEKSLTVANVSGGGFDLQASTPLDGQVDTQPLVVPNQIVANYTARTVVYVATGEDTLYAIDGVTGMVLTSRHFGVPVPQSALPGRCSNNGPNVGISSTPVIDTATGTMYLVVDTYENGQAVFRVHAVSLSTLQDTTNPVVVSASATLTDGSSYDFNANVSRQRAALLLSGSTLYAAFSSYCDNAASVTRGWMLGWDTPSLTPTAHNHLTDAVPGSQSNYFLNSIWMSGYGPSSAPPGNFVYVVTSNSDKNSYGPNNRDESVLMLAGDLSRTQSYFTDLNRASLDQDDADLGAGGAMLSPNQPGLNPKLVFAAGKGGSMYMFGGSELKLLSTYQIGACWCGPSYFTGSDGVGRIVSSGGSTAIVWRLNTSASSPATLTNVASAAITSGQDGGFFTSVSSNRRQAGTAIVWAVGRPTAVPGSMPLYAIDPTTGKIIYTAAAGNWANGNSNANTVPTVANGHVYVATNKVMTTFGLGSPAKAVTDSALIAPSGDSSGGKADFALAPGEHAVWGIIKSVSPTEMMLQDRKGALIRVYLLTARADGNLAEPVVGQAALAIGAIAEDGLFMAKSVEHAKPSSLLWSADQ